MTNRRNQQSGNLGNMMKSSMNLQALERFEKTNFKNHEENKRSTQHQHHDPKKRNRHKNNTPRKMATFNLIEKSQDEVTHVLNKEILEAKDNGIRKVKFIFPTKKKDDEFSAGEMLQEWLIRHEKSLVRAWENFHMKEKDTQAVYVFL